MDKFNQRIKLTSEILSKIAKIDEFKGNWRGGVNLHPQILSRLKSSVIITSAGSSTRIEGSQMSDEEVARLLRGLKTKPPKGRDNEEVAGYADLLGRIFDNYKNLKMTEGQILHLHKILLKFSRKDQAHMGKYKTSDNIVVAKNEKGEQVVVFRPTPPYLVKKEMDDIFDWSNQELADGKIHPLLIIANFIFEFLAIHPFIDGNGRLSRALTNLFLLKANYSYIPYVSLEEIIEERKTDYYLSLRETQKHHKTKLEDISPWLNFFLDVLSEQTMRAQKLLNSDEPEKMLSERQTRVYELFDENSIFAVAEIDSKLKRKIPQVTIKQALSRLVELKLLERMGQGRATRYRKR